MDRDPNHRGHVSSRVPLLRLFGSLVQKILCTTNLVFARQRKNQVRRDS